MGYVLIADDEAAFRQMLAAAVSSAGFAVRTAGDGEEALALAAGEPPELVFMDLQMGARAMTGLDALEAMRARHPEVPVVLRSEGVV